MGILNKNYESQGQRSPNLHDIGRHVGFFRGIGYGHYFTEGFLILPSFFF